LDKDIPLKVVLFAWRPIRDRLPTKDNLIRRGILDSDDSLCVGGSMETSPHLFLHCQFFGEVWHFIHLCFGVYSVIPNVPADFVGGNCSKGRLSILQLIWYATVWKIWKERNNRIFNGKECSTYQIVDKIKSLTLCVVEGKISKSLFQLPCLVA